jgi:hypothetical protein
MGDRSFICVLTLKFIAVLHTYHSHKNRRVYPPPPPPSSWLGFLHWAVLLLHRKVLPNTTLTKRLFWYHNFFVIQVDTVGVLKKCTWLAQNTWRAAGREPLVWRKAVHCHIPCNYFSCLNQMLITAVSRQSHSAVLSQSSSYNILSRWPNYGSRAGCGRGLLLIFTSSYLA